MCLFAVVLVPTFRNPTSLLRILSDGSAGFWVREHSCLRIDADEGDRGPKRVEVDLYHRMPCLGTPVIGTTAES
jgi:hypothetical protein